MDSSFISNKIAIWGKSKYEGKKATATIKRADFIGDDWDYTDTLEGTYTGARTSYKKGNVLLPGGMTLRRRISVCNIIQENARKIQSFHLLFSSFLWLLQRLSQRLWKTEKFAFLNVSDYNEKVISATIL